MSDDLAVEILNYVVDYIEEHTEFRPENGDLTKSLNMFGLSSVQGMLLVGELEDKYNIDLPHDVLLGHDSLIALSSKVSKIVQHG